MPDGWGSSGPEAFTPKTLVTVALAAVEAAGWVPRSAVDGKRQPTAGLVADYLLDNREPGRKARELLDPHMDAATQRVAAVIETLAEAFADSTNDYESNLVAALTALSVEHRQFGLVCSAPSAYQRILNPPTPPAERSEPPVREWLGAIGDKVEITGTICTAMPVDGYAYNTTQMLLVIDAGPTLAKIYTAAQWARENDIQPEATVTIAATVKAHDTYQGDKQTVLTRAKRLRRGADVN